MIKRVLLLIFVLGVSACMTTPLKERAGFELSSMVTIDGKELMPGGQFEKPTLVVVLDFVCSHCKEAASRISDWIVPEVDEYDLNVVGIGRLHEAEDLKLWRNDLGIGFDLVADPDKRMIDQLDTFSGVPAFTFVNESGEVLFRYQSWSSEIGRTLLSDMKYVLDNKESINKNLLVDELFILSRAEDSVNSFPLQMMSGLDARKEHMPDDLYVSLKKNAEANLDIEVMKSKFKMVMASLLDYSTLKEIKGWEQSALGKKLGEMEAQSLNDGFVEQFELFVKSLEQEKPPRHRVELIAKINQLLGGGELMTEVGLTGAIGYLSVVDSLKPQEKQVGFEKIKAHVLSRKADMEKNNRNIAFLSSLYLYQNASDLELNQYIELLETESGRKFVAVYSNSFKRLMNEYNANVLKGLPPILKSYRDMTGA